VHVSSLLWPAHSCCSRSIAFGLQGERRELCLFSCLDQSAFSESYAGKDCVFPPGSKLPPSHHISRLACLVGFVADAIHRDTSL